VYVKDITVTWDDKRKQQMLSWRLATKFEIKTLERLKISFGNWSGSFQKGIFISQQKYNIDSLKETGKTICKLGSTPTDPHIKLFTYLTLGQTLLLLRV